MFFNTAHPVGASFNNARTIDSVLANGLETIPGGSGIMAVLAARNLRRGLAMGLPSGQGAANALGLTPLTAAQLTAGLPAAEVALLNSNGGILLAKTPLWYYVLREAMVLNAGNQLGPLGGRIVAETFVRMLERDQVGGPWNRRGATLCERSLNALVKRRSNGVQRGAPGSQSM